jgi:uncharacterized protein
LSRSKNHFYNKNQIKDEDAAGNFSNTIPLDKIQARRYQHTREGDRPLIMDTTRWIAPQIKKWLLIGIGSLSVVVGVIGIVVPILPTTPFLLLAAACYLRSSKRFYQWLITNRWLGEYIRNYREGRGMPRRTKIAVLGLLWLTIGYSALMVVPVLAGKLTLLAIAMGVTYHVGFQVKTLEARGPMKPEALTGPRDE